MYGTTKYAQMLILKNSISVSISGLALKNPPKKTHPKKQNKKPPKKTN